MKGVWVFLLVATLTAIGHMYNASLSLPSHRKSLKTAVSWRGDKKHGKTDPLAVHICNVQYFSLTSKSTCFITSALIPLRINSTSFATLTMWSFSAWESSLYGRNNNIEIKSTTTLNSEAYMNVSFKVTGSIETTLQTF